MVYCGKPSKGCRICRERKIRCDQLTPGCTQCAKAGRQCPGYRNQLDLMFRNESKQVVKKAKAREAGARESAKASKPESTQPPTAPTNSSKISNDSNGHNGHPSPPPTAPASDRTEPPSPPVTHSSPASVDSDSLELVQQTEDPFTLHLRNTNLLTPSDETRGMNFFYSNYVLYAAGPIRPIRGHFDYVPDLYRSSGMDEKITSSMTAVGLAGFANTSNAPELMKVARKNYITALRLINTALQSTPEATKDSTLLAIMLLGLFETVTGSSQKSLKVWTEHINGAAALVKLRGPAQFHSHAGLRMFMQMTGNIMISCVQREIAFPEHLSELRREFAKLVDTNDPVWRLSEIIVEFTHHRAAIRTHTLTPPSEILSQAWALDAKFAALCASLPPSWHYETVYTTAYPELVFSGCYHIYSDPWIAQLWNSLRTCRILLNEGIRRALLKGVARGDIDMGLEGEQVMIQLQMCTEVQLQLRNEIIASLPHSLGYVSHLQAASTGGAFPNPFVLDPNNTIQSSPPSGLPNYRQLSSLRSAGGYFLLWPLYLIGVMDLTTESIRRWCVARLRSIGISLGIQQAISLAGMVESREFVSAWDELPGFEKYGPRWEMGRLGYLIPEGLRGGVR